MILRVDRETNVQDLFYESNVDLGVLAKTRRTLSLKDKPNTVDHTRKILIRKTKLHEGAIMQAMTAMVPVAVET